MQPQRPTTEVVQRFLIEWEAMDNFAFKERSLALLFQNFCPNNSVLEHVLLKVSALNDFYSTKSSIHTPLQDILSVSTSIHYSQNRTWLL